MKLPRSPRISARIGLTPLIDVVFLLLVFFMLASTFLRFNYLPLTTGGAGQPSVTLRETLIIRVQKGGALDINGVAVAPARLAGRLNAWAKNGAKRAVIRVGPGATTGDLVGALEQARRSRIANLVVVR